MPTKYKECYCEEIIKLRSRGLTIHEIAFKWSVARDTIWGWVHRHEVFKSAYKRSEDAFMGWLAKIGRDNFHNTKFNERIYNRWSIFFARMSDKEPVLEIAGFMTAKTLGDKSAIIDRLIGIGSITATQYETLQRGINLQYERQEGQKVIAAAEYVKQKEKEAG